MLRHLALLSSLCLGVSACSAGSGDLASNGQGGGAGGGSSGTGGASTGGGTSTGGSGGIVIIDPGGGGSGNTSTGGGGTGGGCTGVTQQAEQRRGGEADIIWIIDNSGSMFDEAQAVQNNMNFFSGFIQNTGIDVRVVVISSPPSPLPPFVPPHGVCLPPPLGNGTCPNDSTYPNGNYLHVIQEVASNNGLQVTIDTYPQWEPIIRDSATKTFVIVTDDEADPVPGAQGFVDWVNAQPKFQNALWRFAGLFCLGGGLNCFAVGNTYQSLAQMTGGVYADIGQPDWSVVFQQLADAVIADAVPVDCEWVIPPPPEGETLDPDLVNVIFTRGTGATETIFGVGGPGECTDQFLGWYYDDNVNPTRVIACDPTCPVLQGDNQARIEVQFGCEREPPPDIR